MILCVPFLVLAAPGWDFGFRVSAFGFRISWRLWKPAHCFGFGCARSGLRASQNPRPYHEQRAGKLLRPFHHPTPDRLGREPVAGFDLLGVQTERALGSAAIDPDMFLIGFRRSGELEKPLRRCRKT